MSVVFNPARYEDVQDNLNKLVVYRNEIIYD